MATIFSNPTLPMFILVLGALTLLVLITFSAPFTDMLYFLEANNVRFGLWGWCSHLAKVCSKKSLGYSFDPQLVAWMTKVLIFHPIAAIFTLFALCALIPTFRVDSPVYSLPLFAIFSSIAALCSIVAFAFTIALFTITRNHFRHDNVSASYGPLPWMSLAATLALLIACFNAGPFMFSKRRGLMKYPSIEWD